MLSRPLAHWFLLALTLLFISRPVFAADNFIWIEGEKAASTDIKPHPWYSVMVNKAQLSGGDFLANFSPQEGHATYNFTAPAAGSYTFWIRANPVGDPKLDYQLNGGAAVPIDFSAPVDQVNIASDSKPDLRFIAWENQGKVDLKAGDNTIAFRFHSANNNHGSIDCFVFTQSVFTPNGTVKPGQKLGTDEAGWWSFEPKPENFGQDSILDLRYLNEGEAGESGFIQAGGDSFKLGNGKPEHFWGLNASAPTSLSKEQMDFAARRFAKYGINLVRVQAALVDRTSTDPTKLDLAATDKLYYYVNALKKQGIYVDLSVYFVLGFPIQASDGIPGTADVMGKIPFSLLLFEPHVQANYKAWIKQLMTTPNPYSGKPLAQDPSVAVFEIQNEDSFFFWTFNPATLGQGPRALLEQKFGTWLAAKYGSVASALAAWPTDKQPDDSATDGKASLYGAYQMSNQGYPKLSPDSQKRVLDQIHFLAQTQHDFYADMKKYLRDDLGAKCPIAASNWITAPGLGFIERYTYSGVDVIDKHGYFAGAHDGDGAGWSVRNGQTYTDKTALTDPTSVPFQYVRLPGHPHIHSELAWSKPNRYVGEADLLVSAYESLQGVDGIFFFQAADGNWANSGGGEWPFMMPGELGQCFADVLQYRRRDLKEGDTVIRQVTTVDDVLNLKSANMIEGNNTDFRMADAPKADQADQTSSFDPLSFFVGRVERTFDAGAKSIAVDLSKFIDRDKKIITSSTGEIVWDYGQGILKVDAPKSQAVTGFLSKAGPIKFGNVTIQSGNEYATVHVISLDDQPIATSKKILVQAFTEEKFYGFKSANGAIQDIGRAPITVRNIDAHVTFANSPGIKATKLDEQGYANGDVAVQTTGTDATITLPADSLYTIITR